MNVLIRPLTVDDASVSYKWRNDPEIWRFTGSKPTIAITEKIERDWLENTLSDTTKSRFAIVVDNIYVGNVQLTDITQNKTAEFHIFIGDINYWGKGVATMATQLLINYGFMNLYLKSIYLFVRESNIAAVRVYKKLGFKTLRKNNNFLKMEIENTNK